MEQQLNQTRNKLLNALMFGSTVFVCIAVFGSIMRIFQIGWNWIFLYHFLVNLSFLIVYTNRKKLSPTFKAHFLSISFLGLSLTGAFNFGLSGAYYFCIISSLVSTLIFGIRMGFIYTFIAFSGLALAGVLHYTKIIQPGIDFNAYNTSLTRWINTLTAILFAMGTIVIGIGYYYELFTQNIKFLIQKTEELKKSEERYRSLYESMIDAYAMIDLNGKIIQYNQAYATMLGYEKEELGNLTIKDLTPERWHKFQDEIFSNHVLPNGYSPIYEKEYRKKNGKIFPIELRSYLIKDKSGSPIGMWAIIRDITERKKSELELELHRNKLEELVKERTLDLEESITRLQETQSQLIQSEKLASLGVLTAGIAHEINNPINYINSSIISLEILAKELIDVIKIYETITPENRNEKLEEIKANINLSDTIEGVTVLSDSIKVGAKKTADIVKSLRIFSRIDSDKQSLADINESIDSTLVLLHSQYNDRIEIIKKFERLPLIKCFSGKLNQVFMNLLANAIQAIDGNGTIEITTRYMIDGSPHFKKECIFISISDTGYGIPLEIQNKVFEPFFTTKDIGKGTGLGLAISYGIVEQHKGKMEFVSNVGIGTEFKVYLPI